ncbi:hypothetical protein Tcan_15599 [Toxocara canis]|uniref:Uncharacterized protein n=1 Tax=Toxocara canis TaxID=6265 RepID=A0A0B2V5H2_TOXCA|nr:hypothetical protein Tcan_15599 [Toxocara canis]
MELVSAQDTIRIKRQWWSGGLGNGLGGYFYGHYGGGVNNNYGGTNIGSINTKNVNLAGAMGPPVAPCCTA